MNVIEVNKVTVKNDFVKARLSLYLDKMKNYKTFNENMALYVFSYNNDFVAFEAKDYNISFFSSDYKPSYMLMNTLTRSECTYNQFREHLNTLI